MTGVLSNPAAQGMLGAIATGVATAYVPIDLVAAVGLLGGACMSTIAALGRTPAERLAVWKTEPAKKRKRAFMVYAMAFCTFMVVRMNAPQHKHEGEHSPNVPVVTVKKSLNKPYIT